MATAPLGQFDAEGNFNYTPIGYDPYSEIPKGYMDREGNVWDSMPYLTEQGLSSPKLILSSEVTKDPYISTTGILQQDMAAAQALYDLKKSNPAEFYNQIALKLEDKIYSDWRINNTNSSTQEARSLLEQIKDVNPQAYYTAKLTDLGRNVGWQIGQNRSDRNAPTIEQIKALVPDAMKAGLSAEQIDSIVGNNVNAANALNQQRIANEAASGGNFWTENLIGAAKVGGLALGAAGLDAALSAGATGLTAGGTGLTGGTGGAGGLLNAGAGGAFNLSGAAATQSALGLGSAPTGLLTSSVGLGGTAGAGSLAGIAGSAAAAGLGNLGTGLTAEQLARYTGSNLGTNPTGTTMEELLGQIGDQAGDYPMPGEDGTASQWIPSNINQADVTSLLDYNAAYGLTDSSTLMGLVKQYGPTVAKALLGSMASGAGKTATGTGTGLGGLLGAAGNYALNQYQLGQLSNAYNQNVTAQQAATQQAQQQASFTPVGMTTAFGQSNFQFDPVTGKLTSAGYSATPEVAAPRQRLFGLGSQALPTTADTQAVQEQYITQQQGLLAPGREQQLAQLRNRQYQQGTMGLATGGTRAGYAANAQGLMATNPAMQAYYNSLAQQDAQLAANAPTYAQNLLNQQIATGTGLFGAANTLEQYAQQPLSLSTALGTAGATAGAKSGYYGLLGNQAALQTQLQGQQANIYGQGQAITSASQPLLSAANNVISEWLK